MRIVDKVKRIMKKQQITIYRLAEKTDISQTAITKWLKGKTAEMSIGSLRKISEALSIPLAELVVGEKEEVRVLDEQGLELIEQFYIADEDFRFSVIDLLKAHNKTNIKD